MNAWNVTKMDNFIVSSCLVNLCKRSENIVSTAHENRPHCLLTKAKLTINLTIKK